MKRIISIFLIIGLCAVIAAYVLNAILVSKDKKDSMAKAREAKAAKAEERKKLFEAGEYQSPFKLKENDKLEEQNNQSQQEVG